MKHFNGFTYDSSLVFLLVTLDAKPLLFLPVYLTDFFLCKFDAFLPCMTHGRFLRDFYVFLARVYHRPFLQEISIFWTSKIDSKTFYELRPAIGMGQI